MVSELTLSIGAVAILIADAAIIRSKDDRNIWLKTTAQTQAVFLALGLAAAVLLRNVRYLEYGFIGVAFSIVPFAFAFVAKRKREHQGFLR